MKCVYCGGEMQKGSAPLHIDQKQCHLTLDAVRAWVCEQCGEAYFEEQEVDAIQELVSLIEQKADALTA